MVMGFTAVIEYTFPYRHFQHYFSYIVVVNFIGGRNRSSWENHRPAASHFQILSHNILSSPPRHERDSNLLCNYVGILSE
jgi:hypothetical protein